MPTTTAEIVDLLNLEQCERLTYRGKHPRTRIQRTYGGQVLAQAITAAYATVPDERVIHSFHAFFLRPGASAANIYYVVDPVRDGGTFTTRRVRAEQQYNEIFAASMSFHRIEEGLEHADMAPRELPDPDECPRLSEEMQRRFGRMDVWREWDALDVRFVGDSSPYGTLSRRDHRARMRVWVKTEGELPDDLRLHQAVLAYLSDLTLLSVSVVPHPVIFLSNQLQTASIDHVMWFHRPFRADEWLLYDMVSPSASNALGYSFGRLFQGGQLVATCAQEGLIRPVKDRPVLQ